MHDSKRFTGRPWAVWVIAGVLGMAGTLPAASQTVGNANDQREANPRTSSRSNAARPYFVEFRSRSAVSYGHTFLVHGRLNKAGKVGQVTAKQVAGLHPATESSIPWMLGHIIPVVSETGASDGDTEDEYVTARFRVPLTQTEYADVSAFIEKHQKSSPLWHAVLYNCNAWVADVAKYMGLKTPDSTLSYPDEYIQKLAALNSSASPARGARQIKQSPKASALAAD